MYKLKAIALLAALLFLPTSLLAQIFYKIEGNGLKEPSYLFGTHHLAPYSTLDKFPSLRTAFDSTKAVCGEIDMTGNPMLLAMSMQKYMMAPADSTLNLLVPPDTLAAMNREFIKHAPQEGVTLYNMGMMRPMVLTSLVSLDVITKSMPDYTPGEQLDAYFQKTGKEQGKDIIALETPEMQAELLYCSTPVSKQLEELQEALKNPELLLETAAKLNKAYADCNLDEMIALSLSEQEDPAFLNALLTQRNKNWAKQLPDIIGMQPTFIAVGALHLAGENGIVTLLRNLGYTVTPIQ